MKRIIWESSPDLDDRAVAEIRSEMEEMEVDNTASMSDDEVRWWFLENMNPGFLEDEMSNLNVTLPGSILIIGDIGRWDGRRSGYLVAGNNLSSVLSSHVSGLSDMSVYGDGYNIRADEAHHDGTNHYLYRMLLPNKDAAPLLDAIYYGKEVSKSLLNRYTRSLYPYVAKVYGWPSRSKPREV